jgi:hypothetical protein
MRAATFFGLSCVSALFMSGTSHAQNISPGTPDIVMECMVNNQPAAICQFECGTKLPSEHQIWSNVSRVEFHHKGAGTRSMVFVQLRTQPGNPPSTMFLYLGTRYYCSGATILDSGGRPELRITTWKFD